MYILWLVCKWLSSGVSGFGLDYLPSASSSSVAENNSWHQGAPTSSWAAQDMPMEDSSTVLLDSFKVAIVVFSTQSQSSNHRCATTYFVSCLVFFSLFLNFFNPFSCSQSGRALWCSPVRLRWSSSWCSRNRSSSAATATWTRHTESPREDALVSNMIQQKRWNTTSSNRKFPALSARGDRRRRTMWSDRLKMNRSPDRRGTCSPLLSSLSLTHSVSLPVPLWHRERASTWPVTLLST